MKGRIITRARVLTAAVTVLMVSVSDAVDNETFSEFFARETLRLCPYSDFCTRNASLDPTELVMQRSCCLPCSCHVKCATRGNCCPDADATGYQSDARMECTANYISSTIPQRSFVETYFTVTSCPSAFHYLEITDRCHKTVPDTFEEAIFVSDDNGVVYKNKFCALCNGVNTFETWSIEVQCPMTLVSDGRMSLLSPAGLYNVGCLFWSKKPDMLASIYEPARCFLPHYAKCNETGEWDVYDADVERACETNLGPTFIQGSILIIFYSNVFCYRCNIKGEVPDTKCKGLRIREINDPSITFIMTIAGFTLAENEKANKCRQNEIYDSIKSVCRSLICPVGQLTVDGKCTNGILSMEGFTVAFLVLVSPLQPYATNTQPPTKEETAAIMRAVRHTIALDSKACVFCSSYAYNKEHVLGVSLFLKLIYSTEGACSVAQILHSANELLEQNVNVSVWLRGQLVEFESRLVFDVTNLGSAVFGDINLSKTCRDYVDLERNFDCPRMELRRSDFVAAMELRGIEIGRDHPRYGFTLTVAMEDTVEVCLNDYFGDTSSKAVRQRFWVQRLFEPKRSSDAMGVWMLSVCSIVFALDFVSFL